MRAESLGECAGDRCLARAARADDDDASHATRARQRPYALRGATRPGVGRGRRARESPRRGPAQPRRTARVSARLRRRRPSGSAAECRRLGARASRLAAFDRRTRARRSDDGDGDALHSVVHVAAEVPDGLQRLLVPRVVARAAAELVHALRRVPVERPPLPCPVGVDVTLERGVAPRLPAVG